MATDLKAPFFEAALEVLGSEGYSGLKQARVCAALGVTTGAFYHSFESWHDFTDQLLGHWRRERTERLVVAVSEEPDPALRLAQLLEMAMALPHRAEAAIRTWSLIDPDVARVQATVDDQRLGVIRAAFAELTDRTEAEDFAQAALALLIGFEQQEPVKADHLRWSLQLLLDSAVAARR